MLHVCRELIVASLPLWYQYFRDKSNWSNFQDAQWHETCQGKTEALPFLTSHNATEWQTSCLFFFPFYLHKAKHFHPDSFYRLLLFWQGTITRKRYIPKNKNIILMLMCLATKQTEGKEMQKVRFPWFTFFKSPSDPIQIRWGAS